MVDAERELEPWRGVVDVESVVVRLVVEEGRAELRSEVVMLQSE